MASKKMTDPIDLANGIEFYDIHVANHFTRPASEQDNVVATYQF